MGKIKGWTKLKDSERQTTYGTDYKIDHDVGRPEYLKTRTGLYHYNILQINSGWKMEDVANNNTNKSNMIHRVSDWYNQIDYITKSKKEAEEKAISFMKSHPRG